MRNVARIFHWINNLKGGRMKKTKVLLIVLLVLVIIVVPVFAQGEWYENGASSIVHFIELIAVILMVFAGFMAAGIFAEDLGNAMKILTGGLVILGIKATLEALHHLGIHILPITNEIWDSVVQDSIELIGFLVVGFALWKIYKVAKNISTESSNPVKKPINKSVQKEIK